MMPHVDVLSPEVNEIGSLNTIIVDSVDPSTGRPVLLGRNTDWEGIHNALLREAGESGMELFKGRWGFIIGGGGTTRAAVYALSRMGIERIWLINRDLEETAEIVKQFPQ